MYIGESTSEKSTFKHLEVLINRRNVPSVVKKNFSATCDFMKAAVDAHLIVAALNFFGMKSPSDIPTKKHPTDDDSQSEENIFSQCLVSLWINLS